MPVIFCATAVPFARLRWRFREADEDALPLLLEAWRSGRIEDFLRARLVKVVIENRCNSAQPPGEALVSVALVAGLLANLDAAEALALGEPYAFWLAALHASATEPMGATLDGREVPELLSRMLEVARAGLERRGEPARGRPCGHSSDDSTSAAHPRRKRCGSTATAGLRRAHSAST